LTANTPPLGQARENVVCLFTSRAYYPLAYVLASQIAADAARTYDVVVFADGADLPAPLGASVRRFEFADKIPSTAPSSERMPRIAYYRLFMAESLGASYRRAVYLDSDITLNSSLNPLFSLDMRGHPVAAVQDCGFVKRSDPARAQARDEYLRGVGIDPKGFYFNAGFLLADLADWARLGISERAVSLLNEFGERLFGMDQDTLNAVFAGAALELSPRWNFQAPYMGCGLESVLDPVVFHHLEKLRPWHDIAYPPDAHSDTYKRFLAASPFPDFIANARERWHYTYALKWRTRRALGFLPSVRKRIEAEKRKAAGRHNLALAEIAAKLASGAYADIGAADAPGLADKTRALMIGP